MANSNHTLTGRILKITRLKKTFTVALSLGIRNPHRLLRIIRLGLVGPLHVHGGQKELSWVRVGLTSLGELDVARHGDKKSVSGTRKPRERKIMYKLLKCVIYNLHISWGFFYRKTQINVTY